MRKLFDAIVSPDAEQDPKKLKEFLFRLMVTALAVGGVFLAAVCTLIFISKAGNQTWADRVSDFGTWGDFFGGFVNPFLTFITFISVLITILLQQTELALARKEFTRSANALEKQIRTIDKQNFETTLFNMLSLHNEIVDAISVSERDSKVTGRAAFTSFRHNLEMQKRGWFFGGEEEVKREPKEQMVFEYQRFWQYARQELGHYFRYLYNVIKFIDESELSGADDAADADDSAGKEKYMKLLRAQLSDHELVLIFYNCLSPQGANFRPYVEKYELLDNLVPELLFDPDHVHWLDAKAFGGEYPKMQALPPVAPRPKKKRSTVKNSVSRLHRR